MEIESSKLLSESSASPLSKSMQRENWRIFRTRIEKNGSKSNITRFYPRRKWIVFTFFLNLFGFFMWLSRLSLLGNKNALDLKLTTLDIEVPKLPKDLDGFQIVHMTDLHFDRVIGLEEKIVALLAGKTPDLIVLTGDYKDRMKTPALYYDSVFRFLGKNLKAKHGIYATLGNHDSADMVPLMELHNIKVLINESVEIGNGKSKFTLTGVDDVHYFYSPDALRALDEAPGNLCKIALVHSPEMVKEVADRKYSLYLSGHTHGGQIATPGGKAIVTHLNTGKEFAVGRWRYKALEGYKSSGAGVSGLTLRFFTQSEIALIRLRSAC